MEILHNGEVTDPELVELRKAVGWDYTPGEYDRILEGVYAYFTVRDEGNLIGFVSVISDGVADAFLVDLMVHPSYQKWGIGTKLIKQAVRFIKANNIRCVQVTFNPETEGFYRKLGFHIFKAGIIDFKNMAVEL